MAAASRPFNAFPLPAPRRMSTTDRRVLQGAQGLAHLFDDKFRVLGFRFGIESIVGWIPFIGDTISAVAAVYILSAAVKLRLPPGKLAQIVLLEGIDFVVGLVPFLGDLFDMFFKAHLRSIRIIERHVAESGARG
jgi:hypothetical protein